MHASLSHAAIKWLLQTGWVHICPPVGTLAGISARVRLNIYTITNDPLAFCGITGPRIWNPACSFRCRCAGALVADRHNPDDPLPPLHGGNRLQADDRL